MPSLPPVTQALLLANVGLFALDVLLTGLLTAIGALFPLGAGFLPWQVVSYAFLHGSFTHLLFNMLGVWMFGSELERALGAPRFVRLYAAGVLAAAAAQLLVAPLVGSTAPTVGASGGLFGLLLAYGTLFPNRQVMLLIPPMPVKARTLVIIFIVIEVYVMLPPIFPGVDFLNYMFGNVAHLAHLGGMVGAWLMIRYWRRQPPFRR